MNYFPFRKKGKVSQSYRFWIWNVLLLHSPVFHQKYFVQRHWCVVPVFFFQIDSVEIFIQILKFYNPNVDVFHYISYLLTSPEGLISGKLQRDIHRNKNRSIFSWVNWLPSIWSCGLHTNTRKKRLTILNLSTHELQFLYFEIRPSPFILRINKYS